MRRPRGVEGRREEGDEQEQEEEMKELDASKGPRAKGSGLQEEEEGIVDV